MFDDFQDMDEEKNGDGFAASYEPDEPEGLVTPRLSNFFVGHGNCEKKLVNLINSGAMPHALIFAGPQGIGKSTFAFRAARCLFKNGTTDSAQDSLFGSDAPAEVTSLTVAQDDPVFTKVASGGHPDLLVIERPMDVRKNTQKAHVDVDTARKVAPFLRMTSADGGWRVVIIDDADTMNRNAQNALLKILEEPPSNTVLMLVCHRLGAMIPTIRSRCRVLHFNPLDEAELDALMTRQVGASLSTQDKQIVRFLSQGSMSKTQQLIDNGGIEMAHKVLGMMESWPNFNFVDVHHLADQSGRAGQESNFDTIESVFKTVFETLVFAKAKGEGSLTDLLSNNVFSTLLNHYSLEGLTEICDKLREHFATARFSNLDKRQAVLGAFHIITK